MDFHHDDLIKNIPSIIGIIFLLFVFAFLIVKFGYIRCCDIPYFCGLYYSIDGTPQTAIIYEDIDGEFTIGDPEMLQNSLIQRKNVFPTMLPIETIVSAEMLSGYKVIFVEAKKIDTATMQRFRDFVNKGGKLVWIGDSGIELGENDYMCQSVTFKYLPATTSQSANLCDAVVDEDLKEQCKNKQCDAIEDATVKNICESAREGKQCADAWYESSPNIPYDLQGGICGKTFGEIVFNYYNEKADLISKLTSSGISFCGDQDDSFKANGAENIEACLKLLGADVTAERADSECVYGEFYKYGANYWSRGPSETLTGGKVPAINFANVLGIDFIESAEEENLILLPISTNHPLSTSYEVKKYFTDGNPTPVTKVSTERFPIRSNIVMSTCLKDISCKSDVWPAIVVSNPTGPNIAKSGLVVYFAFPPEANLKDAETGAGANFINNLVDFTMCS